MKPKTYFKFSLFLAMFVASLYVYQYFKKPDLSVIGVVKMSDGIGRQGVEVVDALRNKLDISFYHTLKPCYDDISKKVKKVLKRKKKYMGKVILFEDSIWTPESENYKILKEKKNNKQIRFAYSMFESSQIPAEWTPILNEYFDAVVVPDKFHVSVYEECGVKIPIFVVPLGLNLQNFLGAPIKVKPHHPFVFGNLSAAIDRKNTLKLVKAFHSAFPDQKEVVLRLNARYYDDALKQKIDDYISKNDIKNVIFTQKCLKSVEYLKTFQSIDCYVSPSKGEGYSIQPREAMALGIPAIVSNNTAQETICESGLVYAIDTEYTAPAMRKWGKILQIPQQYGVEYDFKDESLAAALKQMYYNYDKYLASSESLRKWAGKYDFSEVRDLYKNLVSPKKIIIGEENIISKDEIITKDLALYQKFKQILNTPS